MVRILTITIIDVRFSDEVAAITGEQAPLSSSDTIVRNVPDRRRVYDERSTREDFVLYWEDPSPALVNFLGDHVGMFVSFEVPDDFIEDKSLTDGLKAGDCAHCNETVLEDEGIRGAFGSLFCCMMCLNEGEATYG